MTSVCYVLLYFINLDTNVTCNEYRVYMISIIKDDLYGMACHS